MICQRLFFVERIFDYETIEIYLRNEIVVIFAHVFVDDDFIVTTNFLVTTLLGVMIPPIRLLVHRSQIRLALRAQKLQIQITITISTTHTITSLVFVVERTILHSSDFVNSVSLSFSIFLHLPFGVFVSSG